MARFSVCCVVQKGDSGFKEEEEEEEDEEYDDTKM